MQMKIVAAAKNTECCCCCCCNSLRRRLYSLSGYSCYKPTTTAAAAMSLLLLLLCLNMYKSLGLLHAIENILLLLLIYEQYTYFYCTMYQLPRANKKKLVLLLVLLWLKSVCVNRADSYTSYLLQVIVVSSSLWALYVYYVSSSSPSARISAAAGYIQSLHAAYRTAVSSVAPKNTHFIVLA